MADRSPAARAIVAAFNERYELCGPFDDDWQELCLAASVRALADRTEADSIWGGHLEHTGVRWAAEQWRAIAAELEGNTSASSTH